MFIKTQRGTYINSDHIAEFAVVEEAEEVFTLKGYSTHNGTYYFGMFKKEEYANAYLETLIKQINTFVHNVDMRTYIPERRE